MSFFLSAAAPGDVWARPSPGYELRVALATLVQQGEWTLDEKKPVPNAFRIGTYGPKTGVRMTLQRRAS